MVRQLNGKRVVIMKNTKMHHFKSLSRGYCLVVVFEWIILVK